MAARVYEPLLAFALECSSWNDRVLLEHFRAGPEALPTSDYFYFVGAQALVRGLHPDRILTQNDRRRLQPGLDLDALERLLQRLPVYDQWDLLKHCSVDPRRSWMDYMPVSSLREQPPAFRTQADGLRFDDFELQALWDAVQSPPGGPA